ncbi:hypothetical protein SLE2022_231500 [Rubroshorea leprosula]
MQCLSFKTSSSRVTSPQTLDLHSYPPLSQAGTSTEGTPRSSTQASPPILTREYTLAVQSNSYSEIWSRIHDISEVHDREQVETVNGNGVVGGAHQFLLSQLLQPNRESVEEALRHAKPNTLTRLVSTYFDHSENTTNRCLVLFRTLDRARVLYAPIHELLDVLPDDTDSFTQSQCNRAFDIFLQFDGLDNPFPCPGSDNFIEMRRCFSQLKQQLERRLNKSRSRVRLLHRSTAASAVCLIGTVIAVAITTAFVATHALAAIVATPFCTACVPCGLKKKELARMAQLDAAAMGVFVLNHHLRTVDSLVVSLYNAVESDKDLIRLGLESGRDRYLFHGVVKQLHKSRLSFTEQLKDLEEHIFLCFNAVNKARSFLLRAIHLPDSSNS